MLKHKLSIKLSNISYSYIDDNKNEKEVFKRFNLEIKKNTIVGIKGATGKGKSTLGKIILCLLDPYEGYIEIDETKINSNNKKFIMNNKTYTIFISFIVRMSKYKDFIVKWIK